MDVKDIIKTLELERHPEGGYYKRTYESDLLLDSTRIGSAIYYLLEGEDKSHLHILESDEIWHHYQGANVHVHTFSLDGEYKLLKLGNDISNGYLPQVIVPMHTWQCAEVLNSGFALMGCSLSPAFGFNTFKIATKSDLVIDNQYLALIEKFILKS